MKYYSTRFVFKGSQNYFHRIGPERWQLGYMVNSGETHKYIEQLKFKDGDWVVVSCKRVVNLQSDVDLNVYKFSADDILYLMEWEVDEKGRSLDSPNKL